MPIAGDETVSDGGAESVGEKYDLVADEYARRLFRELEKKPKDRELLHRFARETEGRGPVCDMGCGPGQVARFLRNAGAEVWGLDLSAGMVEQARRLNPDIDFRQGNMRSLEMEDGPLAGIAAFYAIVNIPENRLPEVFAEMRRVLQQGGLLLLAFHTGGEVVRLGEMWGRAVAMDFYFYQPTAIAGMLQDAGLIVEEIVERGPYAPEVEHQSHRAYVFARKGTEVGQR